jgi:hypothetical protein
MSIGGESKLVPALPNDIDGHVVPGGISKHGRFEGACSFLTPFLHLISKP